MKKILFVAIGILLFSTCAFAKSYLVIDSVTQEVKSLSPEPDCVLQNGWEQIILNDNYKDIELQHPFIYYKYKNNKWIVNNEKINAEEQVKVKNEQDRVKKESDKQSAKDKLKALGLTDNEANVLIN